MDEFHGIFAVSFLMLAYSGMGGKVGQGEMGWYR